MSYTPSTLVACPNLQDRLDSVFENENARFFQDKIPFSEFLMSPLNRNELSQLVHSGGSKIRTVELTYQPRILSSDVQSNVTAYCTASTERGNTSTTYEIDTTQNLFYEQKFDVEKLKASCESNESWFADQVGKMVAAMDVAVNTKNAYQANALLGGWSTDVSGIPDLTLNGDIVEVRTTRASASDEPYPSTMQAVQAALEASGFGQSTLVGGFQLHNYLKKMEQGCCTDYGLDIGEIQRVYGMASIRDRAVSTAQGDQATAWAVANGALQVLYYNRWSGLFEAQDANQSYGQIMGALGIPYDLVIKHDCGVIDVTITATTKLVALPDDMYQTGDHLDGVKGFAEINVVNS
jgi:hypothetical protein